jgi:hypothetical protein
MQDPIILAHRELRAALHLAERELKRMTLTHRLVRLLMIVRRTLDSAKHAAVISGISKLPSKVDAPMLDGKNRIGTKFTKCETVVLRLIENRSLPEKKALWPAQLRTPFKNPCA